MSAKNFLGLFALLLIALNMSIQSDAAGNPQRYEKSFNVGSRFGRSYGGPKKSSSSRTMVAPRIGRFELGSRYGKRSDMNELVEPMVYPPGMQSHAIGTKSLRCVKGHDMQVTCTYTGVLNIYRCNESFDEDTMDAPQRALVAE